MNPNNPTASFDRWSHFFRQFRYLLLLGAFLGCLLSHFWASRFNTPLFFTVKRSFLFTFEISALLIWGSFWAQPKETPFFYWSTLPIRLIAASLSSISPFLLLKTEFFLGFGSLILLFLSEKKRYFPFFLVGVWLFFLGPAVFSYVIAEFFQKPNTWFLISPLFWVPAQMGLFS